MVSNFLKCVSEGREETDRKMFKKRFLNFKENLSCKHENLDNFLYMAQKYFKGIIL
jgi:hypothetical protein